MTHEMRRLPLHPAGEQPTIEQDAALAGLRCDRVDAPWVLDGAINGAGFKAWIETQLVSTLKPGDIVILDISPVHKSTRAKKAVKAAGAHLLFLPPYSPDLNPIAQAFAKLKTLIRKAGARTVDELWKAAGRLLETFTPKECSNYPKNSGHASV